MTRGVGRSVDGIENPRYEQDDNAILRAARLQMDSLTLNVAVGKLAVATVCRCFARAAQQFGHRRAARSRAARAGRRRAPSRRSRTARTAGLAPCRLRTFSRLSS